MPALSQMEYTLPEQLKRFVGPQVKKEAKLAAARGILPLPPRDLVQILFMLTREDDQEIRQTAAKSLSKMPENILKSICEDKQAHPLITHFLARNLDPKSPLQETIALNPRTHDETIVFQAGLPSKRVVDIISENQMRILRCPPIVDSLAENVLTGHAQLERIIKFVEMETKKSGQMPAGEGMEVEVEEVEQPDKAEEEIPAVTEGGDEDEISAVTMEGESAWAKMTFDGDLLKDHKVENEEEEEEVEQSLYKKVQNMKVSEKIKLALMGGSQARSLLIKDANKMVSQAVLKSPRITDSEIEGISRSRSASDDVIRTIAGNRDWTKTYQVKLNLVNNPKTPLPEAMRFMNFLRDKDLRDLARSRNVPSNVATQAKRILQRKETKAKPGGHH